MEHEIEFHGNGKKGKEADKGKEAGAREKAKEKSKK